MKTDDDYINSVKGYFLNRGIKNNFNEESFWGSKASQQKRFNVLCKIGNLNEKIILDFGCGNGDFLKYLMEENFILKKYIGIDIVSEFIEIAKLRFDAEEFYCGDIEDITFPLVDYAFASGVFCCFKTEEDMLEYSVKKIKYMFEKVNIGVGVNFLSIFSKNKDKFSIYIDPNLITSRIMKEITTNVCFMHNYMSNDFTIFLYK